VNLSSPLLEVLGKRGRVKVLETLYRFPKRDFSINELARESSVPVMTCWRCVKEFENLGIVRVNTIGKTFAVSLNTESTIVKKLKSVEIPDPHRDSAIMFVKRISKVRGVKATYLFGSVLTATHKHYSDVDIAIIYSPETILKEDLEEICTKLTLDILRRTKIHIIPFYLSEMELKEKNNPIVRNILSGELLWKKEH
jgi:predicted nucleotidyltransferase